MGPRLGSRGKVLAVGLVTRIAGFNGAATWKSRKVKRGAKVDDARRTTLQWGRDLEVAESGVGIIFRIAIAAASMGPRLGSRGKAVWDEVLTGATQLQWGRDLEVAESS